MRRSQAGSRVTRPFSCKSGITMMTQMTCEVEADVFRDGYLRLQSQIEALKSQKETIEKHLREDKIRYEGDRRRLAEQEANVKVKEAVLEKRRIKDASSQTIYSAQARHSEAEARNNMASGEIEDLGHILNVTYNRIEEIQAEAIIESSVTRIVPVLRAIVDGMTRLAQEKNRFVMETESRLVPATREFQRITKEEEKLQTEKDEKEKRLNELDAKRHELDQILTVPLDPLDSEEQYVTMLEEEIARIEERLARTEIGDEPEQLTSLINEVEHIENSNVKRQNAYEKQTENLHKRRIFDEWERVIKSEKLLKESEEVINLARENDLQGRRRADAEAEAWTPELCAQKLEQLIAEKQAHLDQTLASNRHLEERIKAARPTFESKWERKMKRIDKYSKRIGRKDGIRLKIDEALERNEELAARETTLRHKIDQNKKRKAALIRKQEEHSQIQAEIAEIQERIAIKKEERLDKERALIARRPVVEEQNKEVCEIEAKVNEFEATVRELEKKIAEFQQPMHQAVAELNDGQQQLDEVIELRSPSKDRSFSLTMSPA